MKSKVITWLYVMAFLVSSLEAAFTLKDGKVVDAEAAPTMPVQDHFNAGAQAMQNDNWAEAARQFRIVSFNFPKSEFYSDALFYQGVAEFYLDELDASNEALTAYLKSKNNPKFFQEAIEYKFHIAEKYNLGYKRRFFGTKKLPKWASGKAHAVQIYDEVIAALPCHDLAAKALYSKGCLQWSEKQYRQGVDAFQMLIKRFPKHELAPESYVAISKIFVEQSSTEFQNPDVLAFAQINLRKFKNDFPREERVAEVESDLLNIKEYFAKGLYDTGQFYERTGKPRAAVIYYQNAIQQFPETEIAKQCLDRLETLKIANQVKQ